MAQTCFTGTVYEYSVDGGTTYVPIEQVISFTANAPKPVLMDVTHNGSGGVTQRKAFKSGEWTFSLTCIADLDLSGQNGLVTRSLLGNLCSVAATKFRATFTNTGASTFIGDGWPGFDLNHTESEGRQMIEFQIQGTGAFAYTQ